MSLFPCTKNMLITEYMYVAHTAFCVSVWYGNGLHMRIRKTFQCRQHSKENCLHLFHTLKRPAYVGLRHARMNASAGLRHAYASLSLLSCRVVKSLPNISYRSYHCVLWAALRSQGQVARWWNILEKNWKGDVKNIFWQRKIRPIILN